VADAARDVADAGTVALPRCRARHYIIFVFAFNQNVKAIAQRLPLTRAGSFGSQAVSCSELSLQILPVVLHLAVSSQSTPVPMIPLQGTHATTTF
jgi:hypothetical protein